eukprot:PhM_4_TR2420/c3_g1_i1/m.22207
MQGMEKERLVRELDSMQAEIDLWHRRTNTDIQTTYHHLSSQIQVVADAVRNLIGITATGGSGGGGGNMKSAAPHIELGASTPMRLGGNMSSLSGLEDTPTASPPYHERRAMPPELISSRVKDPIPINYNLLFQELDSPSAAAGGGMTPDRPVRELLPKSAESKFALQATATPFVPSGPPPGSNGNSESPERGGGDPTTTAAAAAGVNGTCTVPTSNNNNSKSGLLTAPGAGGRPIVTRMPDSSDEATSPRLSPDLPCQVLVEFKRKRILQFESDTYVAPGEYVVVGGDRGEDVGLVIYAWQETPTGASGHGVDSAQLNKWVCMGLGKVIRTANALEVSQLHGVQTELERRAIEVAQQKVVEHQLPMSILDAEYQFDRKKLTFYYEAGQRLDFRDLVRDLYRTFRARIWMEMVENGAPTTTPTVSGATLPTTCA